MRRETFQSQLRVGEGVEGESSISLLHWHSNVRRYRTENYDDRTRMFNAAINNKPTTGHCLELFHLLLILKKYVLSAVLTPLSVSSK